MSLLAPPTGLPLDHPFTLATALDCGYNKKMLAALVDCGHLCRPIRNVYVAAHVPDTLLTRGQALALVVPAGSFVCDRTAAWLHGAPAALAPNEHLMVPQVSVFRPSDAGRLRNKLSISGERDIRPTDLMEVHGIVVTTPLRTALDLGRLQPTRDLRLAGMDAMLRLGAFSHEELLDQVPRFARQRGVVLLKALAPMADGGAESWCESALRLRWDDAGLPRPRTQVPSTLPNGATGRLDMGLEDCRFGAEYDGEEWHSGFDQVRHDKVRREWARSQHAWQIEVFTGEHCFGHHQNADVRLRSAYAAAIAAYPARVTIL